jgi:sulfide:quinone oxidoreductase
MYVPTPISLPVAGTKISQDVVNLLSDNHFNFDPLHKLKKVLDKKTIQFENGNKINYDLLIIIPPHQVPQVIKNSDLLRDGDQNWIDVDRFTLRTKYKNVFAIGDATEMGFCFMEIGNEKAGYIDADFYNEAGPIYHA